MSNLDLTIAEIMRGDTQVLKIMKGDSKVWPSGDIAIVLVNVDHAACSIGTSRIALHSVFSETLLPETSCIMTSVNISMGGVDITSTAYDSSDGSIAIADVTGDIIITATAVEVITFEDANVKTICVNNWGGNVISGEITPAEAAAVTTLNGKFYNNTVITKFNELRYFTGLTTLNYNYASSAYNGQFRGCTALTEIAIPAAPIVDLGGAFRGCIGLANATVDFTPITATTVELNSPFREAKVKKVMLPGIKYSGTMAYGFRAGSGSTANASITTIEIDGTADFRSVSSWNNCFSGQNKLKTLTGTWRNIYQNISLPNSSTLTRDSLLVLINGLYDFIGAGSSTRRTLTLHATAKARLTEDDIAIAEAKGWTIE